MPFRGSWFTIKDWDLFGYPVTLHHKTHQRTYKTHIGGCFSMLLYIGVILFIYLRLTYLNEISSFVNWLAKRTNVEQPLNYKDINLSYFWVLRHIDGIELDDLSVMEKFLSIEFL